MIRQEPNAVQMEPKTNLYQRMLLGRGQDLPLQVLVDGIVISGYHISSDSTSCTSNDCSSEINDGAGERTSHSGACQVTSCEAGFYEKTTGSCSEVELGSGKYSPANDKGTTACSNTVTKPNTATWTNPTKSDEVGDCTWACNDGYARHLSACYTNTRVCDITDSISNKVGEGSQSYQPGTVGNYTACEVTSCIAGYYKDPNAQACIQVGANLGKYSPANDMNTHDCSTKPTNFGLGDDSRSR